MTAAWILVILLGSFICTRIFRSTRMWWIYVSFILAGLLVGMLSKEVTKSSNSELTSYTQLISTFNEGSMDCTQFVATVHTIHYSKEYQLTVILLRDETRQIQKTIVNSSIPKKRETILFINT